MNFEKVVLIYVLILRKKKRKTLIDTLCRSIIIHLKKFCGYITLTITHFQKFETLHGKTNTPKSA